MNNIYFYASLNILIPTKNTQKYPELAAQKKLPLDFHRDEAEREERREERREQAAEAREARSHERMLEFFKLFKKSPGDE